jgi:hypothetical protein
VLVTACAGNTPVPEEPPASSAAATDAPTVAPTPEPEPTPTSAPPRVPPTDAPSLPPDAAPIDLQGTWDARVETESIRLLIEPLRYRITRNGNIGSGAISVQDDVITFSGSDLCSGVGAYRWSVVDAVLTLEPVRPDECPRRGDAFEGVTYDLLFPPA